MNDMNTSTSVGPASGGAPDHKAGFVSILGRPNAGKSTLMNALLGDKLSIVTPKAQTTRHRIFGILNADDYQIVFSDTPGTIQQPRYELQRSMMRFVHASLEDADLILLTIDLTEEPDEDLAEMIAKAGVPVFLVLNKMDVVDSMRSSTMQAWWEAKLTNIEKVFVVSALQAVGTAEILEAVLEKIPTHPAWFPKEDVSDRSERFFASEIIREKIFLQYHQEVPYSTEVLIEEFKDRGELLYIRANILVERVTQRAIIIGHKGEAIKQLGISAREDLQTFFGQPIYLDTHVKVEADWRNKANKLKYFGYDH